MISESLRTRTQATITHVLSVSQRLQRNRKRILVDAAELLSARAAIEEALTCIKLSVSDPDVVEGLAQNGHVLAQMLELLRTHDLPAERTR